MWIHLPMPKNTLNKSPEHSFFKSSSKLLPPLAFWYSSNVALNWAKLLTQSISINIDFLVFRDNTLYNFKFRKRSVLKIYVTLSGLNFLSLFAVTNIWASCCACVLSIIVSLGRWAFRSDTKTLRNVPLVSPFTSFSRLFLNTFFFVIQNTIYQLRN